MFNIKLYHFNKRSNSTKVPASTEGDTFQCLIKSQSSIINPVIEIRTTDSSICSYNYAFIESFGNRYYFVDNVVYDTGLYILNLSVDVLATYKSEINASEQYVLRSTSDYNSKLLDTAYITIDAPEDMPRWGSWTAPRTVNYRILPSESGTVHTLNNYFNIPLQSGSFVIGVIGANATGMEYYTLGYNAFSTLIRQLLQIHPQDMTDVSVGVANAIYDPMQFLVSCRWFPAIPAECRDTSQTLLYIGDETINLSESFNRIKVDAIPQFFFDIDIPAHPQSVQESGKDYLNLSPFKEVNLYFQPFGNIPLDTTKIYGQESVRVAWAVDYSTGLAHMKVILTEEIDGETVNTDCVIAETTSDYGVAIPVSALITDPLSSIAASAFDYLGTKAANDDSGHWDTLKAGMNGLKSWWNNMWNGNAGKKYIPAEKPTSNKNLLQEVAGIIRSANGQIASSGTKGSFLAFNEGKPYIYEFFYYQAESNRSRFGGPLHERRVLGNLLGFCLCANAFINYSTMHPSESEASAVETALNSGVYLE